MPEVCKAGVADLVRRFAHLPAESVLALNLHCTLPLSPENSHFEKTLY
jgi:hypothetical protein